MTNSPKIVVVGGGAGGLELVSKLGKRLGRHGKANVTLVDRDSTHIWKPLLHEIATGVLDQSLDETAYQGHGSQYGYNYQLGTMTGLDRDKREVKLAPLRDDDGNEVLGERRIGYDYLVLSLGSISNDFGTPGVADHCYFLDSAGQAEIFRRAMLNTFLRYGHDDSHKRPRLSIAIVGGGATGVELSAELLGATQMLASYGYSSIGQDQLNVHLIEAAPRLLPALPERIGRAIYKQLEAMGIEIHLETKITQADEYGFNTAGGGRIDADLTVWAAGVRGADVLTQLGLSTAPNNRIKVHQTLQSVDDKRIFAIGDCAACPQGDEDKTVPPRAQAAHQMAATLYKNIRAELAGKPLKSFHYRDLGSLISLSHFDAVGNLMASASKGHLFVEGRLAKWFYVSLYRMHQRAIHGTFNTLLKMIVDRLNRVLRPNLKLH